MSDRSRRSELALCGLLLALFQTLAIDADAKKQPVIFTSPCECIGNHGVSRWAAKIDTQEPPVNASDIKKITPAQIHAWQGPGGRIGQRSERIPAENQWYAVTGRVEKVKIEDDGDVHVELKDVGSGAGMVVELPLGPRWCEMRKMIFSWTNATFPLSGKFTLIQHPIVTIIGKAFYDIDHSGKDTVTNRRNYDQSLAVWEIHPVMQIAVESANSPATAKTSSELKASPSPAIPIPQTTVTSEQFVTLTRPVPVQIPNGSTVLQAGMKLPVLSRDAQTIDVRYMDARYSIPISCTDAK